MRTYFILSVFVVCLCGCGSLRERNIALYEKSLNAKKETQLPPEPTLARKSIDDFSNEGIIDRNDLNDKERSVINKLKEENKKEARKRSRRVFGIFTPND